MKTRLIAIVLALAVFGIVGAVGWVVLRPPAPPSDAVSGAPIAQVSDVLSDGRIDLRVFDFGNREIRLEVGFVPNTTGADTSGLQPQATFTMLSMDMGGFPAPLQPSGPGSWRADVKLPMGGRWAASAGFGDELAEVEFDAR